MLTLLTPDRKSQIAIEYCYTWQCRHPDSHVFWIHASTFDKFEQAYRDIAKELSVPGTENPQNDSLILIREWLSKPENGSWLLVLDNADDLDLFYELDPSATKPGSPLISHLLPRTVKGSMIITTRDTRVGHRLIDREEVVIVPPLAPLDAEQLLRFKIPRWESVNIEGIHDLVELLGFIPLAITQAAAFIQENSITVKTYFGRLKESDLDLQDYLEEDLPDPRRYPDSENSVIRTWKLSFDQIAQQRPRAADLLSIMVLLDRQAIPRNLLKQGDERNIEFDKAIGTLQAYSLIKTEKGGASFEVHRLVQLSTQRWLTLQNRETEWQEKALELMVGKFPSGYYGTWDECESLFLHAKCVTKFHYIHTSLLLQRARLLENIARYDKSQGRFEAAYLQYKDILQTRESRLGKTHPDTLTTMGNLAGVLEGQGKYAKAETINRQVLELHEKVLGKRHPGTLTTMGNLAGVLHRQGKYTEAETINRQTLKLSEVLGKTHPYTLATMNNLALVLHRQGKYAKAETMNRQTLELKEKVFGKTHPDTLTTMGNLALALESQGKYTEAETINRQTLKLSEEVLGKTHPDTLTTMGNLALALESQGKYTEAENINRQTLKLSEEVLGKTHPNTLLSVYCLAYLLQSKKEYEESSILYQRACTGFKSSLGSEHPRTIACTRHYSAMLDNIRDGS
jgi:tetratricopeptide (TPR) repeat protein